MKMKVRAARINKGLTRKQVADAVGVCEWMIGAYEREEARPSLDTALALANLFDMPVEDLKFKSETH